MLYDINAGKWDEKLLGWFDIPSSMLPEVLPSGAFYGNTDAGLFDREIPIGSAVGDQQAALFGHCCFSAGDAKNTYGTGCFLLMNTGEKCILSKNGLLTTIAATSGDDIQYALEGSVFAAGAAIQWLRDGLQMIENGAETESMAQSVEDTNGVYLVPAFAGLGAPHWDPYARGTIVGITRGCTREHLVRATLESIAYQVRDILEVMHDEGDMNHSDSMASGILVDGGVSNNGFLMQFQADILDQPVIRPKNVEATALGAAFLAGLTVGFWQDREELKKLQSADKLYKPDMKPEDRRRLLYDWSRAVERSKGWAES